MEPMMIHRHMMMGAGKKPIPATLICHGKLTDSTGEPFYVTINGDSSTYQAKVTGNTYEVWIPDSALYDQDNPVSFDEFMKDNERIETCVFTNFTNGELWDGSMGVGLFEYCTNLSKVELPLIDFGYAMAYDTFDGCPLTELDLSMWDLSGTVMNILPENTVMAVYVNPAKFNTDYLEEYPDVEFVEYWDIQVYTHRSNVTSYIGSSTAHIDFTTDSNMQWSGLLDKNITAIGINQADAAELDKIGFGKFFGRHNYLYCAKGAEKSASAFWAFRSCAGLTLVDGLQNIQYTGPGYVNSGYDSIGYAFNNCSSLTYIDLSGWKLDSILASAYTSIFDGCRLLQEINLDGVDFSTRVDGEYPKFLNTFGATGSSGCVALTTLSGNFTGISNSVNLAYSELNSASVGRLLNGMSLTPAEGSKLSVKNTVLAVINSTYAAKKAELEAAGWTFEGV